MIIYITFPFKCIRVFRDYYRKKKDVNCIKKHPLYLSGDVKARNTLALDLDKVKKLAKKHGGTINDVLMSFGSLAFKKYFVMKGDETDEISWLIAVSL